MKRLLLLLLITTFATQLSAQSLPLPLRYELPSGYAFNLPEGWELFEDDDGLFATSDDTILQIIDDLSSYDSLQELIEVYSEGYFQPTQAVYYNLPDGRNAARAEYIDSYGDEAVDIAIEASDGSLGYFVGLTYEGALEEYDTILAIAASYNVANLVVGQNTDLAQYSEAGVSAGAYDVNFNDERVTVPDLRDEYAAGKYIATQCPFYILSPEQEGRTVNCGYLFVPENRANPTEIIQLLIMTINKENDSANTAPVIYFEGGPGGSAVSGYEFWYESTVRENHDIILIEQRGTGFSLPSLNCDEYYEDTPTPAADCAERLRDEGISLSAYNSKENAADVADLITALDLSEVNLYGSSYGTRLALTVLRDHPARIRSVILESVYPPNVNSYELQALNAYVAFNTILTNCEFDSACNRVYPNLRDDLYSAIQDLNDNPIDVYASLYDETYEVTGNNFVDDLFFMMYSAYEIPYVPATIAAAANRDEELYPILAAGYTDYSDGEYEPYSDSFIKAVMDYTDIRDVDTAWEYLETLDDDSLYNLEVIIYGYVDDDSEGMFNSVNCVEEVPFNTGEGYKLASELIPVLIRDAIAIGVDLQYVECGDWAVTTADLIENEAIFSDVPVMLLSGEYDPITPVDWANIAAESLSNSYNYFYPALGHGAIDIDPCPTQMALDFLANPTVAPDDSCIADMTTEFYLP